MILTVNNNEYIVKFTHTQTGGKRVTKLSVHDEPLIRHTECKILTPIEGKEMPGFVSIGYAKCHPKDNFNKETGRQLSLKKALEDGDFSKEERTEFWNAYRNWGTKRF